MAMNETILKVLESSFNEVQSQEIISIREEGEEHDTKLDEDILGEIMEACAFGRGGGRRLKIKKRVRKCVSGTNKHGKTAKTASLAVGLL